MPSLPTPPANRHGVAFPRTLVSWGVLLAVSAAALPAAGQEAPGSTSEPARVEPVTLATVIVTATRRREPLRDVPIQVNTLSTTQMERAGAASLIDYVAHQPGVDIKGAGGPGMGAPSIRGVSTGDQTSATVGVYIDDVAFGSSSAYAFGSSTALDLSLLDLHHIELLRGPQGTLYGAGAMGGLLKYVTNEPDSYQFSGKVSLTGAATRDGGLSHTLSTVVNVPLKQEVAGLRVSAFRQHAGGFVDRVGSEPAQDVNRGNTAGARASVLVEPTRRLKIRLTGTAQEIKRDSTDQVDYDAATGQPVNGMLQRQTVQGEPYSVKIGVVSADLEYDFGWARLNAISSAQKLNLSQRTDVTVYFAPAVLSVGGFDVDRVALDNDVEVHKKTQELRLTSPKGTIEWLGGLYYDHETASNTQLVDTRMTADGSVGPDAATFRQPSKFIESALYGDLTWNLSPRWSLTGGLRYARNRQSYRQISDGLLVGSDDRSGSSRDSSRTYLATARYSLTQTSNLYLRAASGYRPGGPNAVPPAAVDTPRTFGPDTLSSYEFGYKGDLLDKTLTVESAVYDIRWKNLQQLTAINGINVAINAGDAHIQGAELALGYQPVQRLRLDASLAYTDAHLSKDAPSLGAAGSRLPNSARLSAAAGAQYSFELAGQAVYAGFATRYTGERDAGIEGSASLPSYRLPRYTLTDLQAGGEFGRWQLALFVRNLFDKHAQLSASSTLASLGGPMQITPVYPRTLGATLTATF